MPDSSGENSAEFYDWFVEADRENLFYTAIQEYYQSGSAPFFTATVNGDLVSPNIMTPDDWWGTNLDESVRVTTHTERHFDEDVLNSAAKFYSYLRTGEVGEASFSEMFWNGMLHSVIGRKDEEFVLGESDYHTVMSTEHRLVEELAEALYENGVEPDASASELACVFEDSTLPYRDLKLPRAEVMTGLGSVPRLASVVAATICKTDDGYELFWIRRSEETAVQPGTRSVIPGGGVEFLGQTDEPVRENTYKEFTEEFFGPDSSEDLFNGVRRWKDEESLTFDYLGASVDPVRSSVLFHSVLFVDDPVVTAEIKANIDTNFETSETGCIELTDEGAVEDFFMADDLDPNAIPVGLSAVEHVEAEYGVPVVDDITID